MTDKEIRTSRDEAIIDGVNVAGCEFYLDEYCTLSNDRNERLPFAEKCSGYSDCLYKQLQRKEQECEELKEYIEVNKATGICETCTHKTLQENDYYRRTFKEIEKIVLEQMIQKYGDNESYPNTCVYCSEREICLIKNILDICSKAKKYE